LYFSDYKIKTKSHSKRKQNKKTNIQNFTLQPCVSQLNLNAYMLDDDSHEIDKIVDNLVSVMPCTTNSSLNHQVSNYENDYRKSYPQTKHKSFYSKNGPFQQKT
jgi:hypothetical protein